MKSLKSDTKLIGISTKIVSKPKLFESNFGQSIQEWTK